MRNYKKEYENYHSRPEQKIRRAARNAARKRFSNADPTLDVHHKDNDPLNNDLNNLSLVTQHYNRKEPRLREKKLKALKSKLTAALRQTTEDAISRAQDVAKLKKKHAGEKEAEKAGYPILLKASAGGGGRGIRLVENQSQIEHAFNTNVFNKKKSAEIASYNIIKIREKLSTS